MATETQRWIEAGKLIAKDRLARVLCPRFEHAYLEVEDIPNPADPEELERIMKCPECGATNALRIRRRAE